MFTKAEIIEGLRGTQSQLAQTVSAMPPDVFIRQPTEGWSAAEYLQHLNQSVTPVGKALRLPPEKLLALFGSPDHPSRSYDAINTISLQALADGARAEDNPRFMPQLPDDRDDLQAQLLAAWDDIHTRLIEAVENWTESELDAYNIAHPVLGALTMREMLLFTIIHNRFHLKDIQAVSA
jgi:hypothetical protein